MHPVQAKVAWPFIILPISRVSRAAGRYGFGMSDQGFIGEAYCAGSLSRW